MIASSTIIFFLALALEKRLPAYVAYSGRLFKKSNAMLPRNYGIGNVE